MKEGVRAVLFSVGILLSHQHTHAQQSRLDTLAQHPSLAVPACIAFVPGESDKFFFTEKDKGQIRIFEAGVLRSAPFATARVTASIEQGFLGITFHPQYPDSPFVYAQYTRSGDRANVVVRYRDSSDVGVDPRTLVVCTRTNGAANHNGGNCHFGSDGKLYVSFGENAVQDNAQDSSATNLRGKILRLNPDGSIPPDNPFVGKPFWSIGHRNSFDFAWDSKTGNMFCSENGPSCNNEVNYVPPRGNMGWPVEGNCGYRNNSAYVRPLYYWSSALPGLTGITVYRAAAFPRLRGKLLFAGNNVSKIWTLTLADNGDTVVPNSLTEFFSYSAGFTDVEVAPDGSLYLTCGASYAIPASRILRLRPVAAAFTSTAPVDATQDSPYVYTPAFSGTPPGLSLVSAPAGMIVDSSTWSVRWTPTNEQALQKTHNVTLRAENGAGTVDQVFTVAVANVNDQPEAFSLTSPPNDSTFTFSGTTPSIFCTWTQAFDPDLDTVRYTVQIDTVNTFNSPALRDTSAGQNLTLQVQLPRLSRSYFWRVQATDSLVTILSSQVRRFGISFVTSAQQPKQEQTEKDEMAVLEQNFPNPFNPSTNIQYTIPKSGYVRLAVFNLLGQEVARIFEGTQSAGTYEVTFDKEGLPTGIYFYRIQAPGFVETRKMIVTK